MSRRYDQSPAAVVLCSLCAAIATPALAQSDSSDAAESAATAPAPAEFGGLTEVVVTARKREELLQTVPVAITALSEDALSQEHLQQPSDLSRLVPSFNTPSTGSTANGVFLSIRGQIASDVLLTLSQPVGLYEDGVNIPHPVGANGAFFDVSRVEVLNGPQGTLYGRNTTGGAVSIVTRNADFDGFHGFANAEYGNYADRKIGAGLNIPIVPDVLAVRVAFQHWQRDGFGKSAITGERFGDSHDDNIGRVSVSFDPVQSFTVRLKAEYAQSHHTDLMYTLRALVPSGLPAPFPQSVADLESLAEGVSPTLLPSRLISNNLFTNYSGDVTFDRLQSWHAAVDMTWDVNDSLSLRSITGYHWFKDFRTFNLTAMPAQLTEVGYATNGLQLPPGYGVYPVLLKPDEKSGQFTQELNASGQLMADRLKWLLGFFTSHDIGQQNENAGQLPLLGASPGGLGFPFLADYDNPYVHNESKAVFTQNDFKFNDWFSITVGGRYTWEKLADTVNAFIYDVAVPPVPTPYICLAGAVSPQATEAGCSVSSSADFSGYSDLFSANFQLTPEMLLYAKSSRGFRGGALQLRAPTFPAARPETDQEYEVGFKGDFFDHRLRTNLAAYWTNYKNKQEEAIVLIGGVQSTPIENAATARIRGFEGTLTAAPVEHLLLRSTLTYLNARYISFPQAVTSFGVVNGSGLPIGTDASPPLPSWVLDEGFRYEVPLPVGLVALDGDYSWHNKIATTALDDFIPPGATAPLVPFAVQNSWREAIGLLNLNLSYSLPDPNLTFTLFGTNVTNKHYQVQGLSFNTIGWTGYTQAPRMFGLNVLWKAGGG
jgi:iron complex outermembrane receptor protein